MALIDKWEKEERNIKIQGPAATKYSVSDVQGEKLFQISMYGSENRKEKGSASQTVQLNKKSAMELIIILMKEFSL